MVFMKEEASGRLHVENSLKLKFNIKKIMSIVCMSGTMVLCTACSGLPEASGDDVPETAVHQSALPASPETTGNNELDEKMELVRARARADAANLILMWYVFYEGDRKSVV